MDKNAAIICDRTTIWGWESGIRNHKPIRHDREVHNVDEMLRRMNNVRVAEKAWRERRHPTHSSNVALRKSIHTQ